MSETTVLRLAPAVRFEPCAGFDVDPVDAEVCAGCGWTEDEHGVEPLAA